MPKLTDDQLLAIVDQEFSSAQGAEGGDISSERALAWDNYTNKPLGNEIEGESQATTSDVSDVIDGIMPSLLRIFTTAENLVSFDPVGHEDMAAAEQESDYVNYVFFKQNPAFLILYTWFLDALVQKNGIVKAWWDESEVVTTETYNGLSEFELSELLEDEELEPIERAERVTETVDPITGQIIVATVHDVEFRRVTKRGRVCVENVPPEEYRISSDARSLDPSGARMVGHERLATRSELIEMGFDRKLVESLPAHGEQIQSQENTSRRDKAEEFWDSTSDRSQEKILVRDGYFLIDADGDGKAERRQLFKAGDRLLINEPTDRQPFHVISPKPLPHKHFGEATAEKVLDVRQINTTLLRQTLMNLYHTNNPGHAVWEQAIGENTLDDLLTTKVGSFKRFARPIAESYAPITTPFMANHSFAMMEYFDKVKRDRTGVNADGEGLSPEALKNIQQSVLLSATDLSKMKVEAIVRIFAETGIKSLFLHIHELLQKHQDKPQIVRLRNQWVPVNPQQWRTRQDMTVNIGLGIGTREQNLLHLNAIWEKQMQMVQAGMMNLTVTPQGLFQTAGEIVKNANLKMPSMFFADPGNAQGPPPNQEQIKLQQQQQALAAQEQQIEARRQQLDAQKAALERQQMLLEHQREQAEIRRKAEADKDKFAIENEKLRNELLEIRLKYASGSELQ